MIAKYDLQQFSVEKSVEQEEQLICWREAS